MREGVVYEQVLVECLYHCTPINISSIVSKQLNEILHIG